MKGFDKALGPDHTSTLNTVYNLGRLYVNQGKLKEAEEMYQRALEECEKALGPDHTSTLDIGNLYNHTLLRKERNGKMQPLQVKFRGSAST